MITLVDSGLGNVGSVGNMLRHIGKPFLVTREPEVIAGADRLILPGVGSFDAGIERLTESGLRAALDEAVLRRRVPVLGICLGMQLMARSSEEGQRAGLSWLQARVLRLRPPGTLPLPHMGWSDVTFAPGARLASGGTPRFYFAHSYHVVCERTGDVSATATYGQLFAAALEVENFYGVQFHPEKSHRFGMELLRRFADKA